MQEGVVKKSHREAGVEVFDGLVRGVLASAKLKTLATEVYSQRRLYLTKNTLRDLSYPRAQSSVQKCSPEPL